MPTAPPFGVGDSGLIEGKAFRVLGRLQLDHGAGPWDEWYVALLDEAGGDSWAWLARAQGRWYLTQPAAEAADLPSWRDAAPGSLVEIGRAQSWRVGSRGHGRVVSCEGELPFETTSGDGSRYVDLHGPGGGFATIDYGKDKKDRMLFVGHEVPASLIVVHDTSGAPRPIEKVEARKLSCPSCGAPLEIVSPDAKRIACQYCYALCDLEDDELKILEKLEALRSLPRIPLGSRGTLGGEPSTVIAYLERFTVVDGTRYDWREYLLYGESGYRWLLEDSGHWTLLRSISPADVTMLGGHARYDGIDYRPFSRITATVSLVIGELYWRVEVGEKVAAADFVAPPRILSREQSEDEVVWSAGEYVEPREIRKAFGLEGAPSWYPHGVAPAQPSPYAPQAMFIPFIVLAVALLAATIAFDWSSPARVVTSVPVRMSPTPGAAGEDGATYSEPFTIEQGPTVLAVELRTTALNDYVGVALALVDENTGAVREAAIETEFYQGVTAGERWSEGGQSAGITIDRVPAGRYTLRMAPEWSHWAPSTLSPPVAAAPRAVITVRDDPGSLWALVVAFALLLSPLVLTFLLHAGFEKRRWENSSL